MTDPTDQLSRATPGGRESVIVVSYNSRRFLGAFLASVRRGLGPDDEVIMVDNGSGDGGPELVRRHYPWVRLIAQRNTGYAGGKNRGAAIARGRSLLFENPDTVLQPGAVDALLRPLEPDDETA
jgi:GT2 family glycosyltransferase